MYKLLGIGSFLLLLLYNFFGLKGPLITLCIMLIIIFLFYINQNKILYIPRTTQITQKSPMLLYLLLRTHRVGGILPNRAATPKTWRSRLVTT